MKILVLLVLLALYKYSVKAFTVFDDSSDEEDLEKRLVDKMENLETLAKRFVKKYERATDEKEKVREKRGTHIKLFTKLSCLIYRIFQRKFGKAKFEPFKSLLLGHCF